MRNRAVWAAVALSAVIVAITSTNANAFCCHKYRSVPIWFGAYYPNCGVCGPCIVPYNISGSIGGCGCGYGGGYGAGCGYGGCGYGYGGYGYGSGAGCVKKHHHGGLFAHKAWQRTWPAAAVRSAAATVVPPAAMAATVAAMAAAAVAVTVAATAVARAAATAVAQAQARAARAVAAATVAAAGPKRCCTTVRRPTLRRRPTPRHR